MESNRSDEVPALSRADTNITFMQTLGVPENAKWTLFDQALGERFFDDGNGNSVHRSARKREELCEYEARDGSSESLINRSTFRQTSLHIFSYFCSDYPRMALASSTWLTEATCNTLSDLFLQPISLMYLKYPCFYLGLKIKY